MEKIDIPCPNGKNMDDVRGITITIPPGFIVDNDKSNENEIVLKRTEPQLPKSWMELERVTGWYINSDSEIHHVRDCSTGSKTRNTWPTRETAKASLALSRLLMLRNKYNDGWTPTQDKRGCIIYVDHSGSHFGSVVLSFKTKELRDLFQKNFAELIVEATPLLG